MSKLNIQRAAFGGLACHVVDALPVGASPQLAVVLCHGFGAPGTDLVSLAPEFLSAEARIAASVRFVFPTAPLSLDSRGMAGGRAWWHLDLEAQLMAIERGEIRNLRNDHPDGLDAARASLSDLIAEIGQAWNLPASRIVIGGFSQGGMIATDVALNLPDVPAALVIYSGTLLCEDRWRELAAQRGALRVVQSHGRQDPILPYIAAEWLRDLLKDAGLTVEFLPFDGPHTISMNALQATARLLRDLSEHH